MRVRSCLGIFVSLRGNRFFDINRNTVRPYENIKPEPQELLVPNE